MFDKNKEDKRELELKGLPIIPENTTEKFFKITIEEVEKTEVAKIKNQYSNKDTGKICNSWDDGEKIEADIFTGETEINTRETKIYEQEVKNLDVANLVVYINRVK